MLLRGRANEKMEKKSIDLPTSKPAYQWVFEEKKKKGRETIQQLRP